MSKEEGGCPGRSRASSLSSLMMSVSPEDEEEANKSKKSLLESSEEEEEVDPMTVAEKDVIWGYVRRGGGRGGRYSHDCR